MNEEAQVDGGRTGRHHHDDDVERQVPCLSPLILSELPGVTGSTARFLSPKASPRPFPSSPRSAMVEILSEDVESPGATLHRKV